MGMMQSSETKSKPEEKIFKYVTFTATSSPHAY